MTSTQVPRGPRCCSARRSSSGRRRRRDVCSGPRGAAWASGQPAQRFSEATAIGGNGALVLPPKLSSADRANRATHATVAFLESDRPDGPRPGDPYGDDTIVGVALPSEFGAQKEARIGGRGLLQYA